VDDTYQTELGERLRAIRQQQGLTLQEVEDRSDGVWKAVVVGSYERGDRAVSVAKLAGLARFYGVPVGELLPPTGAEAPAAGGNAHVVLDLTRLQPSEVDDPRLQPLARFASSIQVQRGDYNGRMLTLRSDDVRALASILGEAPEELLHDLQTRGLIDAR